MVLRKDTPEGPIGTVVPNHNDLKIGTLKGILELARVKIEDFERYAWKKNLSFLYLQENTKV